MIQIVILRCRRLVEKLCQLNGSNIATALIYNWITTDNAVVADWSELLPCILIVQTCLGCHYLPSEVGPRDYRRFVTLLLTGNLE